MKIMRNENVRPWPKPLARPFGVKILQRGSMLNSPIPSSSMRLSGDVSFPYSRQVRVSSSIRIAGKHACRLIFHCCASSVLPTAQSLFARRVQRQRLH